jgi:hypothetical protein
MRRALTLGAVALALLAPSCAGADRPEGVVERWLNSLNQGAAGRPGDYARAALSAQVLPGWRERAPGDLDVIEVGRGRAVASMRFPEGAAIVPFRVVRVSGDELEGTVTLEHGPDGRGWTVVRISPRTGLALPSEGGPRVGAATVSEWLASAGVAVLLVLLAAVLMRLVRRPESPT